MIKVSVLYPHSEGKKFDMTYYVEKHVPLVREKLGNACRRFELDQGLCGALPGSKAPYVLLAHMCFDSLETFQSCFGPHRQVIMADIPNFTDITPIFQFSHVKSHEEGAVHKAP